MQEPIETLSHEGLKVSIYRDELAESPNSCGDTDLFLVHYHRNFWQERKNLLCRDDLRDIYQGNDTDTTKGLKKKYYIFPVSAYIHSGVCLSLESSFSDDSQGWDTAHVGAIFATKQEFKSKSKAKSNARRLIETWNQYLSGDVYGYVIEDQEGKHLDSCYGFYGLDDVRMVGLNAAKRYATEATRRKLVRVKAMIKNGVSLDKREEVLK